MIRTYAPTYFTPSNHVEIRAGSKSVARPASPVFD